MVPADSPTNSAVTNPTRRHFGSTGWTAVLLALQWLMAIIGVFSSLIVPAFAVTVWKLRERQKRWLRAAMIVISPIPVIILLATTDYVRGVAELRGFGHPGTQFFNIDRAARCERANCGCIVNGSEWLTEDVHNATVGALIHTFGYQPGSYLGPYPSQVDAHEALKTSQPISIDDLRNDDFQLGKVRIRLAKDVGTALWEGTTRDLVDGPDQVDGEPRISAALWKDECIILRIRTSSDDSSAAVLVILSRSAGRPFAYYADGNYFHSFPPVFWTPKRYHREA